MNTGKVKFFNVTKGFGFIKDSESGEEHLFLHRSNDRINEDDEVEFELKEGRKGMNAINVKVIQS